MTRRYSCKNVNCEQTAGTTIPHGLTVRGVATAPDEWFFNMRGVPVDADTRLYLTAAPGTTSFIVASASGAQPADVFASINHSIVK